MLRETKSYKQTKNLILSNNSFYTLAGAALEKGWVSVECKSTYSISVCVCVCVYLLAVIVVEQFFTRNRAETVYVYIAFFYKRTHFSRNSLRFSCFDSWFAIFFSWYNFLVSIPLEIKIKYYELDGLARLVLRWVAFSAIRTRKKMTTKWL